MAKLRIFQVNNPASTQLVQWLVTEVSPVPYFSPPRGKDLTILDLLRHRGPVIFVIVGTQSMGQIRVIMGITFTILIHMHIHKYAHTQTLDKPSLSMQNLPVLKLYNYSTEMVEHLMPLPVSI